MTHTCFLAYSWYCMTPGNLARHIRLLTTRRDLPAGVLQPGSAPRAALAAQVQASLGAALGVKPSQVDIVDSDLQRRALQQQCEPVIDGRGLGLEPNYAGCKAQVVLAMP